MLFWERGGGLETSPLVVGGPLGGWIGSDGAGDIALFRVRCLLIWSLYWENDQEGKI